MAFEARIDEAASDPQRLEQRYQEARRRGEVAAFRAAVNARYEADPENVLLAAWHYRLEAPAERAREQARGTHWAAAVALSVLTGLVFWALGDVDGLTVRGLIPQLFLWWSPIATASALAYLAVTAKEGYGRALALGLGGLAAAAYAVLLLPAAGPGWPREQYAVLAAIHIPLLCWGALGLFVLGLGSSTADRFAFLIKSIEVIIVAGLYLAAGVAFGLITLGMFQALGIELPEVVLRLIAAGGFGLVPVLALATVYDPTAPPAGQDFTQGLSRFVATMMRLLLPLTLIVLVIYIFVIPFNFLAPFERRDVLIVYNVMLFAIVGLLLGATPIRGGDLSPKVARALRIGVVATAALGALVSVYALSAVVTRTVQGGLTPNRVTVIGWNALNIGILVALVAAQMRAGREGARRERAGRERWIAALQGVFSRATNAYLAWGLFLLLALPIAF